MAEPNPATLLGAIKARHGSASALLGRCAGGTGAGTIIRVRTRALGMERAYRMVVSEPEPGRVLADADAGLVTTFTVEPVDDGRRCRVVIASTWAAKGGLAGAIERLANPPVARRMYRKELRRLAEYVRTKGAPAPAERLPTSG